MKNLRNCINDKLIYNKTTTFVYCQFGYISIDITSDGRFIVDNILDSNEVRQPHRFYKSSEIEQLIGYICSNEIKEITILDHDTDNESLVYLDSLLPDLDDD